MTYAGNHAIEVVPKIDRITPRFSVVGAQATVEARGPWLLSPNDTCHADHCDVNVTVGDHKVEVLGIGT